MDVELACWWCVHSLPCHPCIHLPIRHDEKTNKFITKGNFCSWQCAKAYALDMNTSRSGEIQMILMMMRRRAFGKYMPLWPAPKREALKAFGGTLTIDEFRSFGGIVEPPMVCFPDEKQLIQTVGVQLIKQTDGAVVAAPMNPRGKLAAIDSATSQGDTLKLKRNKPLERTKSKLENVLGITRKAQT